MSRSLFSCVDAHTCGNPVRLVKSGAPELKGSTMSEKRQDFINNYDWIRRGLMFEPRGHDMMSGSILYPPNDPDNDFAILFIETSGCLPMCGHGLIGSVTIAIEEGLVIPKVKGQLRIETPAGLVQVAYHQSNTKVDWVKLTNVPSFLLAEGLSVRSPELGELLFDVAYGGNFYAIVDPQPNYKGLHDITADEIIRLSREIRKRINEKYPDKFVHPENNTIRGVSHVLWTGQTIDPDSSGRNAVFYGDKAIDRSPCGTGTSARMAQLHAKGELEPGDTYIHESFIGSKFEGRIESVGRSAGLDTIVPSIKGWARVYGYNDIIIDTEDDPYAHGFQVL